MVNNLKMFSNLNLPKFFPEVTLGGHSSSCLTIPRCKIGTRPWPVQSELTLRIITHKQEQNTGHGASTLGFKTHGKSQPKSETERVPVAS